MLYFIAKGTTTEVLFGAHNFMIDQNQQVHTIKISLFGQAGHHTRLSNSIYNHQAIASLEDYFWRCAWRVLQWSGLRFNTHTHVVCYVAYIMTRDPASPTIHPSVVMQALAAAHINRFVVNSRSTRSRSYSNTILVGGTEQKKNWPQSWIWDALNGFIVALVARRVLCVYGVMSRSREYLFEFYEVPFNAHDSWGCLCVNAIFVVCFFFIIRIVSMALHTYTRIYSLCRDLTTVACIHPWWLVLYSVADQAPPGFRWLHAMQHQIA